MRSGTLLLHLALGWTAQCAAAQGSASQVLPGGACAQLVQTVATLMKAGRLADAEAAIAGPPAEPCAGWALRSTANILAASGRPAEAEVFAERALHVMEKTHPPDDPALFGPLQVLVSVRFEQGKVGRAREAFQRMQSIRTEGPVEKALMHSLMAAFLQNAGQRREAEAAYQKALTAFGEGGFGKTADEGSVLCALGSLYVDERRYPEAEAILVRALATFSAAKDTVPVDIVKLLELRGVLYIRMGRWEQAGADLRTALSMLEGESCNDPVILKPLLVHYALVLRKTRRRQEATSLEARAASFRADGSADVVDVTELRRAAKLQ